MSRINSSAGVFASALLATGFLLSPSSASALDLSGKTVNIVVPFKESGGASRYARLWHLFLKDHLPGKPTVLVIYKPGGSGITGSNWFEKNAKTDGTYIVSASTSMYTSYLFGGDKVRFNMLKWRPIILSPLGSQIYARNETGVKGKNIADDIKALRSVKLISGGKNPTSSELRGYISYDLLGLNPTYVFGLNSGGRRKAVLRGELNLSYDSAGSFMSKTMKYIKKGVVTHVMNLGFFNKKGELVRDPAFPNTPTVLDAYKAVNGGKEPSGPQWKALKSIINIGVMSSKSLMLPAGTPDDVVDTYGKAVQKIMTLPKFKEMAKKELGNYPQSFGADAAKVLKDGLDIDDETRKWIAGFLKRKFNFNMM
jgi:tripartite-type tricarboxylate transporter receptor subunit TctC